MLPETNKDWSSPLNYMPIRLFYSLAELFKRNIQKSEIVRNHKWQAELYEMSLKNMHIVATYRTRGLGFHN
jgi:hypothetical protein